MIICPWSDVRRYESVIPGLHEAVDFVENLRCFEPGTHLLPHGKVMIQRGITRPLEDVKAEAHRKYLDIQLVVEGSECCGWAKTEDMRLVGEFDTERDCGFYEGDMMYFEVKPGVCYVLYPEDAHAPCRHLQTPTEYTKLVIKLEL